MTIRRLHNAPLRRRPFTLLTSDVEAGTTTNRETILTLSKGFRARIIQIKILQSVADGRHLCELYFGTAGNLITDPSKGIDILAVPNLGSPPPGTT